MNESKNARITKAELTMANHGVLCLWLSLEGDGWGGSFGGHVLGKGSLNAERFTGSPIGIKYIEMVMDTVGVDNFTDLKGKYVRAITEKSNFYSGNTIIALGNIIQEKWFIPREFFKKELGEQYED